MHRNGSRTGGSGVKIDPQGDPQFSGVLAGRAAFSRRCVPPSDDTRLAPGRPSLFLNPREVAAIGAPDGPNGIDLWLAGHPPGPAVGVAAVWLGIAWE